MSINHGGSIHIGSIENFSGNIDQSQHNNINVYDTRTTLKERDNEKEYEYDMFCIGEYKNSKKVKDGYVRITCVNVHSQYSFITDHIHMDIPIDWWDDYNNHSLIKVKGVVYKYKRSDKNKNEDYSIKVTKILNISSRLMVVNNNPFNVTNYIFKQDNLYKNYINQLFELNSDDLKELLIRAFESLDSLLCANDTFAPGFITNFILTYYFLNNKLEYLSDQRLCIRYLPFECLLDLGMIVSTIIYKINIKEIYTWRHLLLELNKLCNVTQNINDNILEVYKLDKDDKRRINLNNNIKDFSTKIDSLDTNRNFEKIRIRNKDFGYKFPNDIDDYRFTMTCYLMSYALSRNYMDFIPFDEQDKNNIEPFSPDKFYKDNILKYRTNLDQ